MSDTQSKAQDIMDFEDQYEGVMDEITKLKERRVSQSSIPPGTIKQRHLEDTGWLAVVLQNGWLNYDDTYGDYLFRYVRKIGGIVHLRGLIKTGTITVGTTLFTLPAGYRPAKTLLFRCASYNGGNWLMGINNVGTVYIAEATASTTWTSLTGVSFIAEQ